MQPDEKNPSGFRVKIYTDRETGAPKGEATVGFTSEDAANEAITKFNGQYFPGSNYPMQVRIAEYDPNSGGDRGRGRGRGATFFIQNKY